MLICRDISKNRSFWLHQYKFGNSFCLFVANIHVAIFKMQFVAIDRTLYAIAWF